MCLAARSIGRKDAILEDYLAFPDTQEIGAETLCLSLTTQGMSVFKREKPYSFLTRQPGRLPTYPKYLSLCGHHPAANRLSPGKPHLICTPESGGQLTAHRSDPVAQCLGLSPPGPADVVALRVCFG
jgi:hypothetical protein